MASRDTFPVTVRRTTRDSLVLVLPQELCGATLAGILSPDRQLMRGRIFLGVDSSGLFRLARPLSADPDSARLTPSDTPRFWAVFDKAPPDSLEEWLQRDYFAPGTPGLKDSYGGGSWALAVLGRGDPLRGLQFAPECQRSCGRQTTDAPSGDTPPSAPLTPAPSLRVRLQRDRYLAARPATLRLLEAEPGSLITSSWGGSTRAARRRSTAC